MCAAGGGKLIVTTNSKAKHEYDIDDRYEAGIVLRGSEVKSLRQKQCSIDESYAGPHRGDIYVFNMHIAPYKQETLDRLDPKRPRKLLLHQGEIDRITSQITQRGYTMIPLAVYFKRGLAKVELGLGRGRNMADKRRKKEKEQQRQDINRELRRRQKGR